MGKYFYLIFSLVFTGIGYFAYTQLGYIFLIYAPMFIFALLRKMVDERDDYSWRDFLFTVIPPSILVTILLS